MLDSLTTFATDMKHFDEERKVQEVEQEVVKDKQGRWTVEDKEVNQSGDQGSKSSYFPEEQGGNSTAWPSPHLSSLSAKLAAAKESARKQEQEQKVARRTHLANLDNKTHLQTGLGALDLLGSLPSKPWSGKTQGKPASEPELTSTKKSELKSSSKPELRTTSNSSVISISSTAFSASPSPPEGSKTQESGRIKIVRSQKQNQGKRKKMDFIDSGDEEDGQAAVKENFKKLGVVMPAAKLTGAVSSVKENIKKSEAAKTISSKLAQFAFQPRMQEEATMKSASGECDFDILEDLDDVQFENPQRAVVERPGVEEGWLGKAVASTNKLAANVKPRSDVKPVPNIATSSKPQENGDLMFEDEFEFDMEVANPKSEESEDMIFEEDLDFEAVFKSGPQEDAPMFVDRTSGNTVSTIAISKPATSYVKPARVPLADFDENFQLDEDDFWDIEHQEPPKVPHRNRSNPEPPAPKPQAAIPQVHPVPKVPSFAVRTSRGPFDPLPPIQDCLDREDSTDAALVVLMMKRRKRSGLQEEGRTGVQEEGRSGVQEISGWGEVERSKPALATRKPLFKIGAGGSRRSRSRSVEEVEEPRQTKPSLSSADEIEEPEVERKVVAKRRSLKSRRKLPTIATLDSDEDFV